MKNSLYTLMLVLMLPASAWAHSGHAHAPAESLSGVLHSLSTHPLMFGALGLLLVAAIISRRQ